MTGRSGVDSSGRIRVLGTVCPISRRYSAAQIGLEPLRRPTLHCARDKSRPLALNRSRNAANGRKRQDGIMRRPPREAGLLSAVPGARATQALLAVHAAATVISDSWSLR